LESRDRNGQEDLRTQPCASVPFPQPRLPYGTPIPSRLTARTVPVFLLSQPLRPLYPLAPTAGCRAYELSPGLQSRL